MPEVTPLPMSEDALALLKAERGIIEFGEIFEKEKRSNPLLNIKNDDISSIMLFWLCHKNELNDNDRAHFVQWQAERPDVLEKVGQFNDALRHALMEYKVAQDTRLAANAGRVLPSSGVLSCLVYGPDHKSIELEGNLATQDEIYVRNSSSFGADVLLRQVDANDCVRIVSMPDGTQELQHTFTLKNGEQVVLDSKEYSNHKCYLIAGYTASRNVIWFPMPGLKKHGSHTVKVNPAGWQSFVNIAMESKSLTIFEAGVHPGSDEFAIALCQKLGVTG